MYKRCFLLFLIAWFSTPLAFGATNSCTPTSGAIDVSAVTVSNGVICGKVVATHAWESGRMLPTGKFLLLRQEVRNLNKLAKASTGRRALKLSRLKAKLKERLSIESSTCATVKDDLAQGC